MGNRKSDGQKEQLPRAHLCLVLNDLGMVCVWKPHSPCLFPLEWISAHLSVPAPGCSTQASPRPCWGDGAEEPLDGRQGPAQRLGCSAWGPEGAEGIWGAEGVRGAGECRSPPHSHHSQRASVPPSVFLEGVAGKSLACLRCPFHLPKGHFVVVWGGCLFVWGKRQKRLNFRLA